MSQPAIAGNGFPMPGNVNAVLASAGAGGMGAPRSMPSTTPQMPVTGAAAGAAGTAVPTANAGNSGDVNAAAGSAAAGAGGAVSAAAGAGGGAAGQAGGAGQPAAGGGAGSAAPSGAAACGADAMEVTGETDTAGNGSVLLFTKGGVEILRTTMTMLVPKEPQGQDTLFLWPGLQPSSSGGIAGFGVLQPVLTWGGSCNGNGNDWWISGQYVYFTGGFGGARCETGDLMEVDVADKLDIEFVLDGTVWTQNIKNQSNGKLVTFDRDLEGQKQIEVLYQIEAPTRNRPSEDVIFTNSVITLSESQPEACVPTTKGVNDYVSPVRASRDGKICCIDKVILRSSGVAPSSPNEP
jgi:hypothetical protein